MQAWWRNNELIQASTQAQYRVGLSRSGQLRQALWVALEWGLVDLEEGGLEKRRFHIVFVPFMIHLCIFVLACVCATYGLLQKTENIACFSFVLSFY